MSFTDAVDFYAQKAPVGSPFRTKEWNRLAPAYRNKAFFSAGVEDMRFLQQARDHIDDYLNQETEIVKGKEMLKVDGRARFVDKMLQFQEKTGMKGKDALSGGRLSLIFTTQTAQAYGYGNWKQQMAPEILDAFPAAEFVREANVIEERPRHLQSEGEIRLYTDFDYWAGYQNAAEIGGFQTPYPPYGFSSMMGQRPVDRRTAESLGLLKKNAKVPGTKKIKEVDPTSSIQTSVENVDPDIRDVFLDSLEEKKKKSKKVRTPDFVEEEKKHLKKMDSLGDALDVARNSGNSALMTEIVLEMQDERQQFDPDHEGDWFDYEYRPRNNWLVLLLSSGLNLALDLFLADLLSDD